MINLRLLQLVSPSLPVGAYSYSQGLEAAVEAGIVHDAPSARAWIADVLALSVATMEAPILLRLIAAWGARDHAAVRRWNAEILASRETAELRAETAQMGYSLRRLLRDLDLQEIESLDALGEVAFATAFALAAERWAIEPREALAAYLFGWIENQALAAVRSLPLGQTDGQRIVYALSEGIPGAVDRAAALSEDALANFAPGLALASARHETQYTRIFRS
jgi:urease accessory protein